MLDPCLRGCRGLVSGGASGIGRAIAGALAREGVEIVIADRQDATEVVEAIAADGGEAASIRVDLASEAAVCGIVAEAVSLLGGLDLFVHAAAITRHEPVLELTGAAWRETFDTNVAAAAFAGREVGRVMAGAGGGSMLLVGSTAVHHPAHREGAYRAAKAALRSYMETLAIELAPFGVRVNMLTPGAFRTPLTEAMAPSDLAIVERVVPLGRRGDPAELTAAAVLLLSNALSPYTTGAETVVDGGLHLHPLPVGRDAGGTPGVHADLTR
jgi:gluconate 5-dehydrogenase